MSKSDAPMMSARTNAQIGIWVCHTSIDTAPKMNMTVTALRGCFASSTRPIQDDIGKTPSRATAKMSREAATIATLVLWFEEV